MSVVVVFIPCKAKHVIFTSTIFVRADGNATDFHSLSQGKLSCIFKNKTDFTIAYYGSYVFRLTLLPMMQFLT